MQIFGYWTQVGPMKPRSRPLLMVMDTVMGIAPKMRAISETVKWTKLVECVGGSLKSTTIVFEDFS